eukprot:13052845-Alexandrium_andersonii.AAC.1
MPEVWDIFNWSMRALLKGEWPHKDHKGRPWPDASWRKAMAGKAMPMRGLLSQVLGDWKWLWETMQFEQYYGSNACCHRCGVTKGGEFTFHNFS